MLSFLVVSLIPVLLGGQSASEMFVSQRLEGRRHYCLNVKNTIVAGGRVLSALDCYGWSPA